MMIQSNKTKCITFYKGENAGNNLQSKKSGGHVTVSWRYRSGDE